MIAIRRAPLSDVQNAFRRLLKRAAAAGFVAPGGVTPRESVAPLAAALAKAEDERTRQIAELTTLVERCAYAERGTPTDCASALQLCESIGAAIPEIPAKRARRSLNLHWTPYALVIVLAAVLAVTMLRSAASWTFEFTGFGMVDGTGTVSRSVSGGWRAGQAAELAQLAEYGGEWRRPARDVTWKSHHIESVLGGAAAAGSTSVGFDADTGMDGVFLNADDPFTPPLHWTHRLHVFDKVDASYRFHDAALRHASARGAAYDDGERYRANVEVEMRYGQAVAVPSPGPDAVVTSYHTEPPMLVEFIRDRGDGLHVIGPHNGRVELEYTCSVHRQQHDRAALPVDAFVPRAAPLPANVRADAEIVIGAIGGLPAETYDATVRRLHAYFAGFSVAPLTANERIGSEYVTVALARKGVCRHRARSFFITATALGVRTRLVENRCHSFCEVELSSGVWRRLEFRLGDEEGPPGLAHADVVQPFGPVAMLMLVLFPFGLMAMVLFFAWHHRRNVSMHLGLFGPRRQRSDERAWRDDQLRRTQIGAGLRELTLAEAAAAGHDPPAAIVKRLRSLEAAKRTPRDAFELQQMYWDCMHVMRWINGKGAH
jgi:hypothetical protein